MKTFSTLILLRQHRSLCLVSARLPGWIASPRPHLVTARQARSRPHI